MYEPCLNIQQNNADDTAITFTKQYFFSDDGIDGADRIDGNAKLHGNEQHGEHASYAKYGDPIKYDETTSNRNANSVGNEHRSNVSWEYFLTITITIIKKSSINESDANADAN